MKSIRNNKRENKNQSCASWSGTSIIHSGSISCLANHFRAWEPLSFEARRISISLGEVSGSGSVSSSSSTWGSAVDSECGDWRDRRVEAKQRACCWASRRFCAWRCRESSLRLCWSEIAGRLNGRRRSWGAILSSLPSPSTFSVYGISSALSCPKGNCRSAETLSRRKIIDFIAVLQMPWKFVENIEVQHSENYILYSCRPLSNPSLFPNYIF